MTTWHDTAKGEHLWIWCATAVDGEIVIGAASNTWDDQDPQWCRLSDLHPANCYDEAAKKQLDKWVWMGVYITQNPVTVPLKEVGVVSWLSGWGGKNLFYNIFTDIDKFKEADW